MGVDEGGEERGFGEGEFGGEGAGEALAQAGELVGADGFVEQEGEDFGGVAADAVEAVVGEREQGFFGGAGDGADRAARGEFAAAFAGDGVEVGAERVGLALGDGGVEAVVDFDGGGCFVAGGLGEDVADEFGAFGRDEVPLGGRALDGPLLGGPDGGEGEGHAGDEGEHEDADADGRVVGGGGHWGITAGRPR